MAFDFLMKTDIASSIIKSMEDGAKQGNHSVALEAQQLFKLSNKSFSKFIEMNPFNTIHNYFTSFFTTLEQPHAKEVLLNFLDEKNKVICSHILRQALQGKVIKTNKQIIEEAEFIITEMDKRNIFNQEEKNSFTTSNLAVMDYLNKTGFFKITLTELEKIKDVNQLFSKLPGVTDYLNETGDLPNNIKLIVPAMFHEFHEKITNTQLIDFVYKGLKDIYGDSALFEYSINERFIKDLNDDILRYISEENYAKFKQSGDYDFSISNKELANGLLGSAFGTKESFTASSLTKGSPDIAIDYLNAIFSKYGRDEEINKKIKNASSSFMEKYVDSMIIVGETKNLNPIELYINKADELGFNANIEVISKLLREKEYIFENYDVDEIGWNSKILNFTKQVLENDLRTSVQVGNKKLLSSFSKSSSCLEFFINNSTDDDSKKEIFIPYINNYLENKGFFNNKSSSVSIMQFVFRLNYKFVSDFMNTPFVEPPKTDNILDGIENLAAQDVVKEDVRGDFMNLMWQFLTDNIEDRSRNSREHVFNTVERKALVNIALDSDEILEKMKTTKIGNSSFFKKMLNNSWYGEFITQGISRKIDNPIVRSFNDIKVFREMMSTSPYPDGPATVLKMSIDKKMNKFNIPEISTNNDNDTNDISFRI